MPNRLWLGAPSLPRISWRPQPDSSAAWPRMKLAGTPLARAAICAESQWRAMKLRSDDGSLAVAVVPSVATTAAGGEAPAVDCVIADAELATVGVVAPLRFRYSARASAAPLRASSASRTAVYALRTESATYRLASYGLTCARAALRGSPTASAAPAACGKGNDQAR